MNREFIWLNKDVYKRLQNMKNDNENFNEVIKRIVDNLPDDKNHKRKNVLEGFGKYVDTELEKKVKNAKSNFEYRRKIKN